MTLKEIYQANLDNEEMHAYIALYQVLIESKEEQWIVWDKFAARIPAKERMDIQKKFEVYAKSGLYTKLTRVAINRKGRILKQEKSFAIDYCRQNEAFLYDLVD